MKAKGQNRYKLFALLLATLIMVAFMPTAAFAEGEAAEDITVFVTVSDQGNLATANDGSAMAWKKVVVKDLNGDKKFSFDEALQATHTLFIPVC